MALYPVISYGKLQWHKGLHKRTELNVISSHYIIAFAMCKSNNLGNMGEALVALKGKSGHLLWQD